MPFSFHPYQEKDLLTYVRSLQYKLRGNRVHLIVVQGPTGCGKTWLVNHAAKVYSPKICRVLRNEQLYQIFKMGLSVEGTARYIYMGAPRFLFLVLDEWVNECHPSEMDKLVKWLDLLLKKTKVPSTTAIFVTCTSTFHGNAKKLYQFIAPPPTYRKKTTKKKKPAEPEKPDVKVWVKNVKLYQPKDYVLEKYIRARGIHNAKRVAELQTWSGGDIRQLNLLITDRLAYLSAKSSCGKAVAPKEVNVFELVRCVFEGGARGHDDALDDSEGSEDGDSKQIRMKACVTKSLQLLKGVTKEPNERILEFLLANRDRPADQNANLGFGDEERDQELLKYQSGLAEDLSFFDSIGGDGNGANIGYVTNGQLEQLVRSMAMHTAQLELEEYELDDSVKIAPPNRNRTQSAMRWQQSQCMKAKDAVMRACYWYPGDAQVSTTLSRTDPQAYLDFLSGTLTSADRNYGDFSDRLQQISKEDLNRVFPTKIKQAVQLATATGKTKHFGHHSLSADMGGDAKRSRPSAPGKLFMPF